MSRPFRLAPPTAAPEWLLRPAVQRVLARRFEQRVTLLRAGAGFGKTTTAAQAVAENRLAPLGIDVWLSCEPDDASADHLLRDLLGGLADSLAEHLGHAPPTHDNPSIDHVVEALRSAAPANVCLLFDDVHHVPSGSPGAAAMHELVERLPANGHLVFAGRSEPPVPLARLVAIGAVAEIGEAELAFDLDEAADVVRSLGRDTGEVDVARLAGWPALVRLAATSGRAPQFIEEEVLGWLDDDQRQLLMLTVAARGADEQLLGSLGRVTRPTEVLASVPLVHRRVTADDTRFVAHDLWHDVLGGTEEVTTLRISVSHWLVDQERFAEAIDLELASGQPDDDLLVHALGKVLSHVTPPRADRVRAWHRAIPASLRARPEAVLLDGLRLRLDDPGGDATRTRLQEAADGLVETGRADVAVGALAALAFADHVRRDTNGLISTFGQLARLAELGITEARPYESIGQALLATAAGDPEAVLSHTTPLLDTPLPPDIRGATLWLHANALNNTGHDATEPARRMYDLGLAIPGFSMVWIGARWRRGRIAELLADPMITEGEQRVHGAREDFLSAVWRTIVAVGVADLDLAEQTLRTVLSSDASETRWQTAGSVLIPHAAYLHERGDVEGARALMRQMLDAHPLDGDGHLYAVASLCMTYWLLPDTREHFHRLSDAGRLGPLYERDLRLMRAYVDLVESAHTDHLAGLELVDEAGALIPAMGLLHAAELLAACDAAGNAAAEPLVVELIDLLGERTRRAFRAAADHATPLIARGAKGVLERLPVPPSEPVQVSLFGGTTLRIGGAESAHPDWRRERVRALLTFLATNRRTTREAAIAALWPDADPDAGRRNLRSTLNMLNGTLEPGRRGGDAPYFVRSVGQQLSLQTGDRLVIDVVEFERLLAEADAAERDGTPSRSIEPLRAAIGLYAGDLLPDSYDDWVMFARDRLRARFVAASVRCAELVVAIGDSVDAVGILTPALAIEPWSEPAHRAVVAAHLAAGDVAAARRAMATCVQALDEIGGPSEALTQMLARRLDALA